jgi:hypothetical protein
MFVPNFPKKLGQQIHCLLAPRPDLRQLSVSVKTLFLTLKVAIAMPMSRKSRDIKSFMRRPGWPRETDEKIEFLRQTHGNNHNSDFHPRHTCNLLNNNYILDYPAACGGD